MPKVEERVGFTPGPWFAVPAEDNSGKFDIKSVDPDPKALGFWVARTFGGLPPGTQEANAHLIAAAPDLYEALKECALRLGALALASGDLSEVNAYAIDMANAALQKAEGR